MRGFRRLRLGEGQRQAGHAGSKGDEGRIEDAAAQLLLDPQRTFGGPALREVGANAAQCTPRSENKQPGDDGRKPRALDHH